MGSFMSLKITFNKPFVEIDEGTSMGSFKKSEIIIRLSYSLLWVFPRVVLGASAQFDKAFIQVAVGIFKSSFMSLRTVRRGICPENVK